MNLGNHKLNKVETRYDVNSSWTCENCCLDIDYIHSEVSYNPPTSYYEWRAKRCSSRIWKRSYEFPIPLTCEEVLMDEALE